MRAWVARRREGGALLDTPAQFGATPAPLELLVVEVTDQGKRRPTRVARLMPLGQRVAALELVAPRLVWMQGWRFVLSGIEEGPDVDGVAGRAQSWVCQLAVPQYAAGFFGRLTHKGGVALRHDAVMDRYGRKAKGPLVVEGAHSQALGRHTIRAALGEPGDFLFSATLFDAELAWMSEERFSILGLQEQPAGSAGPARLLRQGWLCEFDIQEPEFEGRRPKSDR